MVITYEVHGDLAIGEPAGGLVARVLPTIRWEVGLDEGHKVVVVAGVHNGVPKCDQGWHLRSTWCHHWSWT